MGSSSRETLPRPDTVTVIEAASLVLRSCEESLEEMPKLPTPPPKEAG